MKQTLRTPDNVDELKKLYEENSLVYYTPLEELFNTVSHALGAIFAVVMLGLMLRVATTPQSIATAVLSCFCLGLEFAISAGYHGERDLQRKRLWRRVDFPAVNLNVIACGASLCLLYGHVYGYIAFALSFVISFTMLFCCLFAFDKFHKIAIDELNAFDYETYKANGFKVKHLGDCHCELYDRPEGFSSVPLMCKRD